MTDKPSAQGRSLPLSLSGLTCLLALIALLWWGYKPEPAYAVRLPCTTKLIIERDDGQDISFQTEVARTHGEQMRGLMYRRHLPPLHGMIFDFGSERDIAMWMKNTYIPLDMLFIDTQGKVIHIAEAKPESLDIIRAPAPARYVLEINAREAGKQKILAGSAQAKLPLDDVRCWQSATQ